ncbi:MAG TPA: aspartyl/asparaginyl beta-hydroxylase domain-containing protein [Verrucomicrobiae bacterium]
MRPTVRLPFQFDPPQLQADLRQLASDAFVAHFNTHYYQGDWSVAPFRSVGGKANQIYPDPMAKDAFADTPLLAQCPCVRNVLASFHCPQQAVRFMRLKPGSSIREHRDYSLAYEDGEVRLHIPVVTNSDVEFVLNGEQIIMREGECWYHNFNLPHRVANRGTADRVHLVIDCVVNDWLREILLSAEVSIGSAAA